MTIRRTTSRRQFLAETMAAGSILGGGRSLWGGEPPPRPKVAVILTWMTHLSHAHVIMENFLYPYLFCGKLVDPGVDVVAVYADQFPENDMTRDMSKRFNLPLFPTLEEALTRGGDKLAVDAVLAIGEHGEYPKTEFGIDMYPRKEFFDRSVAVMQAADRMVPYFNDKHFSYRWDWSREMYDTAKKLKIPFMAGSSVPLAAREPLVEIGNEAEITEAVSIHGGPIERYDFHGFELLQSVVEHRPGGETGVERIEVLKGDDVLAAIENGRISRDLYEAAIRAELGHVPATFGQVEGEGNQPPHAILITYRDGLKGTVLRIGRSGTRWNIAYRMRDTDKPQAIRFNAGPWNNRNLFKALSHAIQTFFITETAPYPVERTLLTTGLTEAAVRGYYRDPIVETPHLNIAYQPQDFSAMRENGESWKILTDKLPSPKGLQDDRKFFE